MKKIVKRLSAMGLAFAIVTGCFQGIALNTYAQNQVQVSEPMVVTQNFHMNQEMFPNSDELFVGYVENVFYENSRNISTFSNMAGLRLTAKEKQFYDELKGYIFEIAEGQRATTDIKMKVKFTWTAKELGIEKITYANCSSLVGPKFREEVNYNRIWDCLFSDCPYEMYWYDKTKSTSNGLYYMSIAGDGSSVTVYDIQMGLPVAKEYQNPAVEEEKRQQSFNTELVKSVVTAKNNAQAIVDKYASLSRYEKLYAYQKEICEMVSYNDDAGNGLITDYGNPWQLIWVFDGDENTGVVCEGYSKAFQYLCDLSDLTCYNVSGVLSWDYGASGSGGGRHMWNIVTFGGENYLVDVTNIEHLGDFLFMTGEEQGMVNGGYHFVYDDKYIYSYVYDEDQIEFYGEEILKLATKPFDPSVIAETEVKFAELTQNVLYTGDTVEITAPKVMVNGVECTGLEVTYGYRKSGEQSGFIKGLPTEVGCYDVQAYVGEEDLRKPGQSNIITVNIVLEEGQPDQEPTPVTDIFDDVADTDWFADEVQYVFDKGIMTGVSDTIFEPGTPVTRATIVQTLYKLEGKPAVSDFEKYNSLNDTLDSIWWKNGLAWALNEGVAKGDSKNNVFNPDNEVTREDLATFIYRYAQYKGVDVELEGTVDGILGETFVNSWAKTAFAWAIETGLIKGKTINGVSELAPQVGATRAELATIMMRFYENNNLN